MRTTQALSHIADVTASQWGLITAAQARSMNITRVQLARLADEGHLERVIHGVYRDSGVPTDRFETIQANWLATNPGQFAWDRIAKNVPDFVVSGISATRLFEIGDFESSYIEFTSPKRKQTQRPGIRFKTKILKPENITYQHGLPVTRVEQTITDLIAGHEDISHVAQILSEASKVRNIDETLLTNNFSEQIKKFAASQKSAIQTLEKLKDYAGLSEAARLSREISSGSMKHMLEQIAKVAEMKLSLAKTPQELVALKSMTQAAAQLAASMDNSQLFNSIAKTQQEFKKLAELKISNV